MNTGDPARTHRHLWVLADGTPAHAAPGRLSRNEDGDLACHLCGRWFAHLGAHLRVHGWTASQYRDAVGLTANRALCNERLSGVIAQRQSARFHGNPVLQGCFADGRTVGLQALADPDRSHRVAPEAARAGAERLRAAREQHERRRGRALEALAGAAGAGSVGELLRARYESGASLEQLRRLTGFARARLRRELVAAGTRLRSPGVNAASAKAGRADLIDVQVGARVGTDDVREWLRERHRGGATTTELAVETGRSTAWVRARLRGTTTTGPAAARPA